MQIISVALERRNHAHTCGTLRYSHAGEEDTILWTLDAPRGAKEVAIEFFPGSDFEVGPVVKANQDALVKAVLDRVFQEAR
ncbi:MAG: hypothetical protein KGL39_45920 [Patescibacteria group bacterium]|nr:hypothetical protein [Patescibacteria group bacterium]